MDPGSPEGDRVKLPRLGRRKVDERLHEPKLRALDRAFELGSRTLADLGGVWAVDGGYTLYALDHLGAEHAVICDDDFTQPLTDRAGSDSRLSLVRGNFGSLEVARAVGSVDAVVMFDVLLHQVAPDWDEVLALYADRARAFVLSGPWWTGSETIRLPDLPANEYLEKVPNSAFHSTVIDRLDEINPERNRPWRDCHDIWQWGITDHDLKAEMAGLGFDLHYEAEDGPWRGARHFADRSYVFRAS